MTERKRRWKRWVKTGRASLTRLCWMARRAGMEIIDGRKAGLCMWNEIALYGTSAQMRETELRWAVFSDLQQTITRQRPDSAWGIDAGLPRAQWTERELPAATAKPQGGAWPKKRRRRPHD